MNFVKQAHHKLLGKAVQNRINTKIVFYSFFRKTILCKKKLLVAKQAVHNDSTNAEKRVFGKLSYIYRKPSKQEQDKTSNNTTYKQRNKENIKEQKKV